MSKYIPFALVLLSMNLLASTVAAQAADRFEQWEVREILNEYDRAWNSKNVKSVGDLLDDKYVYFSSVGTLSDKKSTLEFLAKPDYKLTSAKRSEHKLHSFDGKTAVISSRWQGKGSWSGGEINDDQRCGQVFVKTGDKWKIVSEHCVQITAK
jgi:ketosteroid isomerase-like protein